MAPQQMDRLRPDACYLKREKECICSWIALYAPLVNDSDSSGDNRTMQLNFLVEQCNIPSIRFPWPSIN